MCRCLSSVVCHPSSVIRHLSSIACHPLSVPVVWIYDGWYLTASTATWAMCSRSWMIQNLRLNHNNVRTPYTSSPPAKWYVVSECFFPTRCSWSLVPMHRQLPRSTDPWRGSINGAAVTLYAFFSNADSTYVISRLGIANPRSTRYGPLLPANLRSVRRVPRILCCGGGR